MKKQKSPAKVAEDLVECTILLVLAYST